MRKSSKAGREYEELTRSLVARLASDAGIEPTRLECDVPIQGRASVSRIDVLWEFRDEVGATTRVLFECRSYGRRITQQALHSWRSIVDDVSADGVPTIGVMVTRVGYQSGARAVAETYGVLILELRQPTDADLANRASKITATCRFRVPRVTDLQVQIPDESDVSEERRVSAWSEDLTIETGDRVERLVDLLLTGELNHITDEPTPMHRVVRNFDPPALLRQGEQPIARIVAIAATVGEDALAPFEISVGHRERVAWMLRDSLLGSRVWFAEEGRTWRTPD